MQEKKTDKVIIDSTRSVHGDWQEDYWISLIHVELTIMEYESSFCQHFSSTVKMRSNIGGHSVCECSVCTLSGTSIVVIRHCDIPNN